MVIEQWMMVSWGGLAGAVELECGRSVQYRYEKMRSPPPGPRFGMMGQEEEWCAMSSDS